MRWWLNRRKLRKPAESVADEISDVIEEEEKKKEKKK